MILKIITFNVAHGRGMDGKVDLQRQAEVIKEYKPDIVFLQEVDMYTKRAGDMNQIREFSKAIGLYYCSMESNITLEDGYYGDGIISRFPISFSTNYLMPLTDMNHEQRGILCNRISFGTTKINLFSVHLSTYQDERILAAKEINRIMKKMTNWEELQWRGLVKDVAGENIEDLINNKSVTFYWGTDPTADSLHLGHYSSLVTAKRLMKMGHKPILLLSLIHI